MKSLALLLLGNFQINFIFNRLLVRDLKAEKSDLEDLLLGAQAKGFVKQISETIWQINPKSEGI